MSTPDRMLSILDLFRDDTTAAFQEDVMAHLDCSRATAYRDLAYLRDALMAPIEAGAMSRACVRRFSAASCDP